MIPVEILKGNDPKYISVTRVYRNFYVQKFMEYVNASFWARSQGGSDDLGNKWKPLAESTIIYKPLTPIEKRTFRIGKHLSKGLLTPAQRAEWNAIFAANLKRLMKKGIDEKKAAQIAAQRAWAVIKAKGASTKKDTFKYRDQQINIRTGKLVASTRPGTISNNRYYPPKNQKVTIPDTGMAQVELTLPYVDDVDAVRPIFPANAKVWARKAHDFAITMALIEYNRVKESKDDPRRSTPRNSKTPSKPRNTSKGRNSNKPRR